MERDGRLTDDAVEGVDADNVEEFDDEEGAMGEEARERAAQKGAQTMSRAIQSPKLIPSCMMEGSRKLKA